MTRFVSDKLTQRIAERAGLDEALVGWVVKRLQRPLGFAMGMFYLGSLLVFLFGASAYSLPRVMTWQSAPTIGFEMAFSLLVVPACLAAGTFVGIGATEPAPRAASQTKATRLEP